jgi:3-deoxy-7-phosphoheptulonate synthase
MIIVMASNATGEDIAHVKARVEELGCQASVMTDAQRTIINIICDDRTINKDQFVLLPHVERVIPVCKPYKLASREFKPDDTIVDVDGITFGGKNVVVIA